MTELADKIVVCANEILREESTAAIKVRDKVHEEMFC